jgi:ATP-dependent DNA helicase RecG
MHYRLEQKLLPPVIENIGGLMVTYYADIHAQLLAQNINERVIAIIEYVAKNGSINNAKVQQLLNVSKPTATRLLKQCEEWLAMKDMGRQGTNYYTKWNFLMGS